MRQNWREKFALLNSVELQFCFCIVRRGWVTSKMLPLTRSRLQQHCASHGFPSAVKDASDGFPTAVKDERTLESLFLFSSLVFLSFACFGVCTALWSRSTEAVVETVTLQSGKPWNKVDLGYVWSGRAWDAAGIYLFSINLFVIFLHDLGNIYFPEAIGSEMSEVFLGSAGVMGCWTKEIFLICWSFFFFLWREAFCDLLRLCVGNEFSENPETLGSLLK